MVDLKLPKKRKMKNLAPVWKRFVSFILDFFIIQFVIMGPFTGIIESKIPASTDLMANMEYLEANPNLVNELSVMLFVIFILIFVYNVIFTYKFQQTPGMMILNLSVAPINKKDNLKWTNILIRNLVFIPIFPLNLLWIVDPVYLLVTGNRLSDKFAKTTVVEEISI